MKKIFNYSDSTVGENRYSEKRTTNDYIDEIMSNKLELEDFSVSQVPQNGSNGNIRINHENSDSQLSKNSLSSKENSYNELGLTDYNGNSYNYDYSVDGYYNDQYNTNGNMQQANGPSIMNGTTMYDDMSNPAPVGNSPFDDYLNPSNIKNSIENKANGKNNLKKDRSSIFSDGNIEFEDSVRFTPTSSTKRKSVVNNENIANIPLDEKVYNTKELNPKYCKAIYPFNKSMEDELELEANDLVDITKEFDDGWATGVNLRSGEKGFFPLNCLLEFYVTDKFAEYGGSKENSESYVYSNKN